MSNGNKLDGLVKHRVSDFIVEEIDANKKIIEYNPNYLEEL